MSEPDELARAVERAFQRFTTPPRSEASPRERAVLELARRFELEPPPDALDPRSTLVAGFEWGMGPAVLLVHGWGGRAAQLASFVAPLVEAGFRVLAFDAPAHGDSPGERTSFAEIAALVAQIGALRGPLHGIVGHSLGGAASLLALSRGVAVERAVLIAPTASLHEVVLEHARARELTPDVTAGLLERMRAQFTPRVWEDTTPVELAPRIVVETLVIADEHDPHVSFAASAALAAALPRGRFAPTTGLGHLSLLRTRAVVERVAAFVA